MSSQLTQQVCSVLLPTRRRWHEAVVELEKIKDEYIKTGDNELVEKFRVAKSDAEKAHLAYKTESMKTVKYGKHEIVAIDALCVARIERVIGRTITSSDNFETQNSRVISVEIAQIEESNKAYDALRILPSSLQKLFCPNNNLQELPELPSGLRELYCFENNLQTLPDLPNNLQVLNCSNNRLQELPELPSGLQGLDCYNNNLQELPDLPSSLQWLDCHDNNLKKLPELPSGLLWLYCLDNHLQELPVLPSGLRWLNCHNNKLQELPEFPDSLRYIDIQNTPASKNPDVIRRLEEFKKKHPSATVMY
jgi:Leucine-rich repeat (LRR) protein